ncbi:MAG: hypothetical protein HZB67_04370 [Candidatus Aenigmarchaeota archaeon]|nr:hypothetical protein [Candidatus Aenigmarchaeota archaeon]
MTEPYSLDVQIGDSRVVLSGTVEPFTIKGLSDQKNFVGTMHVERGCETLYSGEVRIKFPGQLKGLSESNDGYAIKVFNKHIFPEIQETGVYNAAVE